jgi:hypothetical protein
MSPHTNYFKIFLLFFVCVCVVNIKRGGSWKRSKKMSLQEMAKGINYPRKPTANPVNNKKIAANSFKHGCTGTISWGIKKLSKEFAECCRDMKGRPANIKACSDSLNHLRMRTKTKTPKRRIHKRAIREFMRRIAVIPRPWRKPFRTASKPGYFSFLKRRIRELENLDRKFLSVGK